MAIDNTARQIGHRRFAGWLKTLAIALGVMAIAYVAVVMNNDRASPLHAFAATAVSTADATEADPSTMLDEQMSWREQAAVSPQNKTDSSKSEPRECRPDQGIVDDCTFD